MLSTRIPNLIDLRREDIIILSELLAIVNQSFVQMISVYSILVFIFWKDNLALNSTWIAKLRLQASQTIFKTNASASFHWSTRPRQWKTKPK